MWSRVAAVALLAVLVLEAQAKLSVQQLLQFVQSSLQLHHEDKRLAAYLKKITLREKLDDRIIEELQGQGIGPRTLEALQALRDSSKDLAVPPKAAPKPPPPPPIPPPSMEDQNKVLDEVREYAMNYSKRLPDFICTQVTRRFIDPSGLEFWQKQDVITAKLTYFEQKEDYKIILVNSQPITKDLKMTDVGGSSSTGEFGSMLREIFDPKTETRFQWSRWATLRGRRQYVFAYWVRKDKTEMGISYASGPGDSQHARTAYEGFVYIDTGNNTVTRIRRVLTEIPPTFPIQRATRRLDYDMTDISGSKFVLPLKYTMRMRDGKGLMKNEAGVSACIASSVPSRRSRSIRRIR
ncbi:MAG: hypothetical protein U0Q16_11530 [Bryobacteraceae bacterium]